MQVLQDITHSLREVVSFCSQMTQFRHLKNYILIKFHISFQHVVYQPVVYQHVVYYIGSIKMFSMSLQSSMMQNLNHCNNIYNVFTQLSSHP